MHNVIIPDSVVTIGDYAFQACYSLKWIIFGTGLKEIGEYAFDSCDALKNIYYGGTQAQWKVITKKQGWNNNTGDYAITYEYVDKQ